MAKIFSESQLSAINTRDRSLLVSAAAGSGKTTTLTERIIRSLFDEEHPESIRNMLIVTFTNASVDDLRDKISAALTDAISKNPNDKRLSDELYMLPSAKIMTIDAFCAEIVRANSDKVGISPSYRIAESAEIEILTSSIMEFLINNAFSGRMDKICTPKEIELLSDCLTDSKRTKNLCEVLRMLYERSKSSVMGVGIFSLLAQRYKQGADLPAEDSFFGKELMRRAGEALLHYESVTKVLFEKALSEGEECKADADAYSQYAQELARAARLTKYTDMRSALCTLTPPKLKPVKANDKTEAMTLLRSEYAAVKDGVKDVYTCYFSYSEEQWKTLLNELGSVVSSLARFLEKFDTVYTEDKRKRGICEHSDVERYAYSCLYNPDFTTTDVADAYKSRFSSVYIDEYQDVNELQDAIFRAVARDDNRFMVGDIKQSIYSFRSARPDIFKNMKTLFAPLADAKKGQASTIFLSQNFRCDRGVVNFVNSVFDTMFSVVGESIGYTNADALVFSKLYPDGNEPEYTPAEIFILDRPTPDENSDETDIKSFGPAFCAKKIRELLEGGTLSDGRKISPSDIAIVLRKKSGAQDFWAALDALGIKAEMKDKDGFFTSPEILIALSLLNSIDNPRRDIYLAALMCSPLYAFTPDELLRYRTGSRADCLYTLLKNYIDANPCDEKLAEFLSALSKYRELAEGMEVHELIYRLFCETGLFALAAANGERERLLLFYNYSRKFEAGSFKGLYSFIKYINAVVEKNAGFDEGGTEGDADAVKIVTVHSSKGLEYPIVFFAEASRELINLDARSRVLYEEEFGISFCLRAPGGLALVENPINSLMRDRMKERFFEEELRVLYVALTRAREKLFIIGDIDRGKSKEDYLNKTEMRRATLTPFGARRIPSFLDIIMTAKTDAHVHFLNPADELSEDLPTKKVQAEKMPEKSEENVYRLLMERFAYEYPKREMAQMPAKLSVSRLYPDVLDGANDNAELLIGRERRRAALPEFYTGKPKDESARDGIATHMVLQFCDFNLLLENADKEIDRLLSLGFISKKTRERVRVNEIRLFAKSALIKEILEAKRVWRELRFNTTLPAELFTEDEKRRRALMGEELFVQGVIDCLYEDQEGNIHLVDYKTDRLTKEELESDELAAVTLTKKHSLQLGYYAKAVEKMLGKTPKTVSVYSLPLGKTVSVI